MRHSVYIYAYIYISLALVGLEQETIVVQGLPINEAYILGGILSILFSDFKIQGLKNIPTPPMVADTWTNVHPLLLSVMKWTSSTSTMIYLPLSDTFSNTTF